MLTIVESFRTQLGLGILGGDEMGILQRGKYNYLEEDSPLKRLPSVAENRPVLLLLSEVDAVLLVKYEQH